PGTVAPGSSVDRDADSADVSLFNTEKAASSLLSIRDLRRELPIFKARSKFLYALEKFKVVIVVGQTGCGKTTQIPQYLHEAGWTAGGRIVACTQPRRVAATSVAARVATELNTQLGQEVGYSVRFEDRFDPQITRIKYMTDGLLLREILVDPLLQRYSVIMVDEAHERSLATDLLLGVLKKIMKKRDLRVIVSSATVDCEAFKEYFEAGWDDTDDTSAAQIATIVSLEGRCFPIDIQYLQEPTSDYVLTAVETVMKIHKYEAMGDVLVFLTGRDELTKAQMTILENYQSAHNLMVVQLHGGLTLEEQHQVFDATPRGFRKIVLATNIAEASVTIDGIVYVVDSGFVKMSAYNPTYSMERLVVTPISKASAQQRAGRAGRTRPGKAFRLYTEEGYNSLRDQTVPELQRSNLASTILQLKALGVENILRFDYVSPPKSDLVVKALELLYSLKSLDDYGRLSMPFGMQLAELPLDPCLGAMLLSSVQQGCSQEILSIAAMLSVQNVFLSGDQRREAEQERRKFAVEEGDHLTYLNVYNAFLANQKSPKWSHSRHLNHQALLRAVNIRKQLAGYMKRFNLSIESVASKASVATAEDAASTGDPRTVAIRKAVVAGYFANAARLNVDGSYSALRGNVSLYVHPGSVLFERSPAWVVYHDG
ncbi:ATPdependent RNA helicase, partial [Nowakowskiella sp. JEL0078]